MEWTVVSVLVVIVGLFFTVGKPIYGLLRDIEKLRFETATQDKEINRDIDSIKELSKIAQAHENRLANEENKMCEVNTSIAELLKVSQSHELRIHDLECDVQDLKKE